MKIAEIRFLKKGEQVVLPHWTKFLTDKMRQKYIFSKKPFTIAEKDDTLYGVLSLEAGQGLPSLWREKAEKLLVALAQKGAGIVIPPYEGECPQKIMPIANGKIFASLFAFDGAAEALRRSGKNPEEAHFLIAGSDKEVLPLVLAGMGNYVNHLSFFVDDTAEISEIQEELFAEKGLLSDAFSSPQNTLFSEADAVIVCGMEQTGYEHILKRYAVFIDAAGNRPALRRLSQRRWDVASAEGFYFSYEGQQMEGRKAEAMAFVGRMDFREFWMENFPKEKSLDLYVALKEGGFSVSGFSAFGKRIKIAKNQG